MAWAKLDDRFDTHPKVLRAWQASPAAIGLWTMALTYAARNETDGFIPAVAVAMMTQAGNGAGTDIDDVALLCEVGLWEAAEGGWQIHDFGDYNPTGKVRAKRAKAGRAGGKASGEARRRAAAAKREAEAT